MVHYSQEHTKVSTLSGKDFSRLSQLIQNQCGIKMPPSKKTMLETRVLKRMRNLGIMSFENYCDYVLSLEGMENELLHLLDVVTTNKTDFFREPEHFNYLVKKALPELIVTHGSGIRKKLMVWSAGCSSGEEPYTLAMVLNEFVQRYPSLKYDYSILATDISTVVLEKGKRAVYEAEKADSVPMELKKKYFMKSKDKSKELIRIAPELRGRVKFRRLNFLQEDFGLREKMDIIFCRNVIIYFDKTTQAELLHRFYQHLIPGGYIFMGHSETLNALNVPFVMIESTVYRKPL